MLWFVYDVCLAYQDVSLFDLYLQVFLCCFYKLFILNTLPKPIVYRNKTRYSPEFLDTSFTMAKTKQKTPSYICLFRVKRFRCHNEEQCSLTYINEIWNFGIFLKDTYNVGRPVKKGKQKVLLKLIVIYLLVKRKMVS